MIHFFYVENSFGIRTDIWVEDFRDTPRALQVASNHTVYATDVDVADFFYSKLFNPLSDLDVTPCP